MQISVLTGVALGKDATLKEVNGKHVLNFSVAETVGYGDKKYTQWYEVSKWFEKPTELVNWLKKGTKVSLQGRINLEVWEKDGKNGSKLSFQAQQIELIGDGKKSETETKPETQTETSKINEWVGEATQANEPDDLPF
jgi:single-strand DNA-binding protein